MGGFLLGVSLAGLLAVMGGIKGGEGSGKYEGEEEKAQG